MQINVYTYRTERGTGYRMLEALPPNPWPRQVPAYGRVHPGPAARAAAEASWCSNTVEKLREIQKYMAPQFMKQWPNTSNKSLKGHYSS